MALRKVKYLYFDAETNEIVFDCEGGPATKAPALNAERLSATCMPEYWPAIQEVSTLPAASAAWLGRVVRYREEDGTTQVVVCVQDRNDEYEWERLT
jgi:hypothetical protein